MTVLFSFCTYLALGYLSSAVGVTYGPSLVSLTKYDRTLRGPTYFSPSSSKYIPLINYPNYSVVIPLVPDSPSATSNQVFLARRISGPGEFEIEAPNGYGVMAVIQSLDLRTAMTGCNDFIQFGEVEGVETTGICGKVDNRDGSFNPSGLVGPRVFLSPSGRMRMLFYHGYIWGLVRNFNFDILDPSRNPVLRVEVVFTAYKDCNRIRNQTEAKEYRPCSTSSSNSNTCINSQLFCDRIVNCAFEQDFGSDEDPWNCHQHLATQTTTTTTPKPQVQSTTTESVSITSSEILQQFAPVTESVPSTTEIEPLERPHEIITQSSVSTTFQEDFGNNTILESEDSDMPHNDDGELFVDTGNHHVHYETIDLPGSSEKSVGENSQSGLVAGIVSLAAIIIILLIVLRVYYSYNKVIWNPNSNSSTLGTCNSSSSVVLNPSDPNELIISNENDMKCTKDQKKVAFKKDKSVEMPPSYDALFPIPEK